MKSRYNYRVYPTSQQKSHLSQLFGCTRVVWNDALNYCQEVYSKGESYPGFNHLSKKFLKQAKRNDERTWLKDVSSIPLQQSLKDLDTAFQNFFSSCNGTRKGPKLKHPRFKKRKSAQSARFTKSGFKIKQNKIYLAKVGDLKCIWSRPLPSAPTSVTLIKDAADRYFLSFVVEVNPVKLPKNTESIGIDLGILDFATLSTVREKIKAPKPLKARLKKLRKFQRKLSKKQKGSNRRERARKRVAKLHAKIKDIRTDFLHKFSTRLIRENQTVVLEDLNTSGMVKNRKLSRAISDLGWRAFREMLEARAEMYGRDFRVISRWEPTSQRCSSCGEIGGKKELSVREWTCLYCGAHHDRDINAAINIKVAPWTLGDSKRTWRDA
ncbi:transposase, IS605 OrfB family, central region [Gloeocapsa sp. PCC 73106]|nr:transposase, IS605 OrfB family, central region [Gloeocapsa sp. PCC 73106]